MRRVAAVAVNHNTSLYTELLLRSLFSTHPPAAELGLSLTVLDNASEDDTATLRAYAATVGVPVLPSGLSTHTARNSHGELLRRFVLDHPEATHVLFLDTDTVFQQLNAVGILAGALDAAPEEVYAAGPRMGYPWTPGEEIPSGCARPSTSAACSRSTTPIPPGSSSATTPTGIRSGTRRARRGACGCWSTPPAPSPARSGPGRSCPA